jgi:hypothetical protein
MDNYDDEGKSEIEWQEKCDPNTKYKVTITITSEGCSSFARIEMRYSRGQRNDEIALMTDHAAGLMPIVDTYPFATLLQLDHAIHSAEFFRENNMPTPNYSPGNMSAADIISASLMGHINQMLEQSAGLGNSDIE